MDGAMKTALCIIPEFKSSRRTSGLLSSADKPGQQLYESFKSFSYTRVCGQEQGGETGCF
jgi:hypothetical protein